MNEQSAVWLLAALFFLIALLYSSVGFGGGSSYIALLSLFVHDFLQIKTTALLCNLVVVAGGSFLFAKNGYFDRKRFLSVAACSVPAAFAGATIHLSPHLFFLLLGSLLVLSGLLLIAQMFIGNADAISQNHSKNIFLNITLGSGIGFLSGLAGIGGGIFLSPVLNLMHWDNAKKIAALASFFILVNSVAGLCGQLYSDSFKTGGIILPILLLAVGTGGVLGTRMSLQLLKPHLVKGLTGFLVGCIGLKLVLKYGFSIEI